MNPEGPRKKGNRKRIPPGVLQPGTAGRRRFGHRRSPRSVLVPVLGGLGVIVIVLVIVGLVAGSDNGGNGDSAKPAHQRSKGPAPAEASETPPSASTGTTTATTATTPSGQVSLALRSTADVWVCLVDERGRALVNSETLTANQTRGPFDGRQFEVTFGNGSVQMTVNGQPAKVPAVAEPIGFRITSTGAKRLSAGAGPSCT